jgi:hypothetical protein
MCCVLYKVVKLGILSLAKQIRAQCICYKRLQQTLQHQKDKAYARAFACGCIE